MTGDSGLSWRGRRLEAVVFDVDGTLVDSIDAYYEVFRQTCAKFGLEVKREDVLEPMAVGSNIWERAIPPDLPHRDALIDRCLKELPNIFLEVIRRTRTFPGLDDLLERLRARRVRLAILTSSWKMALLPLKEQGLLEYFDAVITREDGYPRKPDPGGIRASLEMIGAAPTAALCVGDSPLDIRAGKAAGTWTIGVLSGIAGKELLESEAPDLIITQVGELRAVLAL
ncbi:MAG: HAD family hydrolase [Thermodesulfobacteriota bacterium]